MNYMLRESKSHGTPEYPYSHYTISNLRHSFQMPVHWHDELEVIYVRQGKLWVNVGGTVYNMTGGQVVIVNPRQLHLMGSDDMSVRYHTLLFPVELISFQSQDELEQTVFHPLRTGKLMLRTKVLEAVLTPENLALLDRVVQINDRKNSMYQLETRLLLLRFLMEVLRICPLVQADTDENGKLQREMLEYIRIHYKDRITLSDMAKQFHLSSKYYSRYFKEHFHLTFSEYIGQMRMDHARDLLENTDLNVTEIAIQCGFSGISFFIRRFTEANGCSPLKWRQQHKNAEKYATVSYKTAEL